LLRLWSRLDWLCLWLCLSLSPLLFLLMLLLSPSALALVRKQLDSKHLLQSTCCSSLSTCSPPSLHLFRSSWSSSLLRLLCLSVDSVRYCIRLHPTNIIRRHFPALCCLICLILLNFDHLFINLSHVSFILLLIINLLFSIFPYMRRINSRWYQMRLQSIFESVWL
jgi:hypothetical protein